MRRSLLAHALWIACVTLPGCTIEPVAHAAPSEPALLQSLATLLPPCESTTGDGRIDVHAACIDGLCGHHNPTELHQLANTASCHQRGDRSSRTFCTFDGMKAQRTPQERADDPVRSIFPIKGYTGKTTDGLGLGVSLACFIDALPSPTDVDLKLNDQGVYTVDRLRFDEPRLAISDSNGDGKVDSMQITSVGLPRTRPEPRRSVPVPQ